MTTAGMQNSASATQQHFTKAVAIIIISIFLFDVQGTIIKHLGDRYPVTQISFYRNVFGLLPGIIALMLSADWHRKGRRWKLQRWLLGLSRGFILVLAQLCFYFSLITMELATATTLAFAGPLFITTLSIPLLGHRVGIWRGLAVVLGFVGVIMVMQPGADGFTRVALLPVGAAFFYALSSLSSRFFDPEEPTPLINLYAAFGTITGSGCMLLLFTDYTPVQSATDWCWILAMGCAGGVAVLLMISGYRMAEPSSLSPFEYFGIPFSFILGWMFFAETPFDKLFPGVVFIVGGGLLVLWRERKLR